jgi:phospholipid/cholesterol/gamma-HCH transport system substrate-binding protein
MKAHHSSDPLRAGVFVVLGVVAFTLAIFLLGQKSALFTRTNTLLVYFDDISGLVVGAPVRLAGLEVGTVAALKLSPQLSEKKTQVRLLVQSRYLPRIRASSEAFIDSNGLLGDKIVNISMGDPGSAALADGATLRAGRATSLEGLAATVTRALGSATNVVAAVDKLVGDERTVKLRDDLARGASSLAQLLAQVEHGDGLAHRLLYDRRLSEDALGILAQTHAVASRANGALRRVNALLEEVERGDGSMHALLYEADGKRALANLAGAAGELQTLLAAVREGEGMVHTLVYDPSQAGFLRDLGALAGTLNQLVQDVAKGRGTVGGLLRDPTVYEDLKTLLGNVQRNVLFKALVRFTIERDGLRQVDERPKVEPAPSEPPAAR